MNLRWSDNLLWLCRLGTASIGRANAWLAIHTLRALEYLLPVWCLSVLFGPTAAAVAGWQLLWAKPNVRLFDRLPVSWRPPRSRRVRFCQIWRQWTRVNLTKLLTFWPDRLANPRWQRRGRCTDLVALERLASQDRPVILAIVHFGPMAMLRYWLRAQGLAAASLVAHVGDHLSTSRRHKQRLSDRATGMADVPHILDVHQLRTVLDFLQPRRFLIVAVDGGKGESWPISGPGFSLRMATGAVRLASRVNGIVVPCLIRAERSMAFTVHLGAPVPAAWVADRRQRFAACAHLLQEFLPILRAHPEQCAYELLWRLQTSAPLPDGAVAEFEETIP